jgi:hypothetical protein
MALPTNRTLEQYKARIPRPEAPGVSSAGQSLARGRCVGGGWVMQQQQQQQQQQQKQQDAAPCVCLAFGLAAAEPLSGAFRPCVTASMPPDHS